MSSQRSPPAPARRRSRCRAANHNNPATCPPPPLCLSHRRDALEHGQYDSNGGLDFHLPIEGSVVEEPPLQVVHIAVEMAPICKVGGLVTGRGWAS